MTGIIQKSIHGIKAFVDPHDMLFGRNAIATGGRDKPMVVLPGSPDTVAIWDDFIGDTGRPFRAGTDATWRILDGDTGNDTGSNVRMVPGTSGILRINLSDTNRHAGATTSTNGMGIVSTLAWKGNQGSIPTDNKNPLRFGVRLKLHGFSDTGRSKLSVFAGFTDDNSTVEAPCFDTGGAVQSGATDAVGFFYSSTADTGWAAYAVNGGVDATPVLLDATRTASRPSGTININTYDTLELEIHHGSSDTGGTATFYVNGQPKGSINGPLAMNVALTPVVYIFSGDTGGAGAVDIDWINVSGPRDSGL